MEKTKDNAEIRRLQRETASLQKAIQAAVTDQQPLTEKDLTAIAASQRDGRPLSPAQARMVLLKVRVLLKTLQGLEKESRLLRTRMDALLEDQPCPENGGREDGGPGTHDSEGCGSIRHSLEGSGQVQHRPVDRGQIPHRPVDSCQVQHSPEDREQVRHSLGISRVLLLQLEAEAKTLVAAYKDLEQALSDAGQAFVQADQIRLLQTAEKIRQQIRNREI